MYITIISSIYVIICLPHGCSDIITSIGLFEALIIVTSSLAPAHHQLSHTRLEIEKLLVEKIENK